LPFSLNQEGGQIRKTGKTEFFSFLPDYLNENSSFRSGVLVVK